jgi:hypothetical protein
MSEEDFSCFTSFMHIFKGLKFPIQQFHHCLKPLISLFDLSCLISFISFPQAVSEAIRFLSYPSCEQFESHFVQSISILIQNFTSLTIDQLCCLSNSSLEQNFSSNQLQIENEDYLFGLVKHLIEIDPKKRSLLKTLHFDYISSELAVDYFQQFPVDELDSDLFQNLIQQIFSSPIRQNQSIHQYRNQQKIPFIEEIQNLKKEISSLQNQIKINEENSKKEIEKLQNQIEQSHPEIPVTPIQSQIEQWIGKKRWILLYKARRDGFSASSFHSKCDSKGPTVTIIKSSNGF